MIIIIETSRTNCFVSPNICKDLVVAGLTTETAYQWKIYYDVAKLSTFVFDLDNYCQAGSKATDFIYPPHEVLPAYSIKDVEKLLPIGYLLTITEKGYEASLSSLYPAESCKSDRMPDAFALLLLQSIRNRYVDLKKINLILPR